MTIDERRRRLRRSLEEVLGPEEAGTLMDDLGAPRHEFELLGRDIQTFIVSNAAMVLAVATLAFRAARPA